MAKSLVEIEDGKARLHLHPGQTKAWDSKKRFVFMLAGTQGGKTAFGPWWLHREIQRNGKGDYLAVTASYDLFKLKMLPEMRHVFEQLLETGRYWAGDKIMELRNPETGEFEAKRQDDPMWGRIILRSANSPGGLESATAKAAWGDECGQDDFDLDVWEAIRRRLSLSQGRFLGTTTLYNRGWLKQLVYDNWREGHKDYDVIQFASYVNPAFPEGEFHSATQNMQTWKVNMFYLGEFDRPAGLIYDCVDEDIHFIPRFAIPDHWPRYLGLDFGGVNTAGVFIAEERIPAKNGKGEYESRLYGYRTYKEGSKTAKEHKEDLLKAEERLPFTAGGAKSEGQWRDEFAAAGLPIREPKVTDVEVGIDRVYGAIKSGQLYFFDDLEGVKDELGTYSRELDDMGEPTKKIKNKERYHFLDAIRYIMTHLRDSAPPPSGTTIDDIDMSVYKSQRRRASIWE